MTNKGMVLEHMLDFTHQVYRNSGKADITKKEVPKVFNKKKNIMCYTHKTGFDYEGTVNGGLSICIEAKEAKERLYIDSKGKQGFKLHQLKSLLFRGQLGALVGVIWKQSPSNIYLLNYKFLHNFYHNIYEHKNNGILTKSISLKLTQNECPIIFKNGMIDYLDIIKNV